VKTLTGISMLGVGQPGVAGGGEKRRQHGRMGVIVGMHKVQGKMPFGEYAKAARAKWAERGDGGMLGKVEQRRRGWVGLVGS
jgi:hypothetical protein